MGRYYFDLRDSDGIAVDEEGLELGDIEAVQEEAARSLADAARDTLRRSDGALSRMAVEVRTAAGPLMHVRFSFEIDRKN